VDPQPGIGGLGLEGAQGSFDDLAAPRPSWEEYVALFDRAYAA
jgi:hypothetical protein